MRTQMLMVNIKQDRPSVEEARARLRAEIDRAKAGNYPLLKIIHGYGSSGMGGDLKHALRSSLRRLQKQGRIRSYLPGENWHVCEEPAQQLLLDYPDLSKDSDLNRCNEGMSIVVL